MDQVQLKMALICWSVLIASRVLAAQPIRANDFLNSLGVTTKVTQGLDSEIEVNAGLQYTGIRDIRDDSTHNTSLYATFCDIHRKTRARVDLISIVDADPNNIVDSLAQYEALAACGAMLQAEGPNEPNNFPFTYQGVKCGAEVDSYSSCAAYQKDLYAAVHEDPKLAGKLVADLSEPAAEPDNQGLQFLTIPAGASTLQLPGTKYADIANLHNYVQGLWPQGMLADNQAWGAEWSGPALGAWDGLDGEYINKTWRAGFTAAPLAKGPRLPKETTETGWQTGSCGPDCITQDEQGKLFINVYLTAAKLGWLYTFFYQMFDQTADGSHFGLFSDHTPTPKLSAVYIHNLTTILADDSSLFTPTPLSYSVTGETTTIHDQLFQKSNRTYELAIWGDRPVSGERTRVTVNLPTTYPNVSVYDVTIGTSPVSILSEVRKVSLTITDHAFVVEFYKTNGTRGSSSNSCESVTQ
jgi:hypothetical protein